MLGRLDVCELVMTRCSSDLITNQVDSNNIGKVSYKFNFSRT
jgi:hypothetical protein